MPCILTQPLLPTAEELRRVWHVLARNSLWRAGCSFRIFP